MSVACSNEKSVAYSNVMSVAYSNVMSVACSNVMSVTYSNVMSVACSNVMSVAYSNVMSVAYSNVMSVACSNVMSVACSNVMSVAYSNVMSVAYSNVMSVAYSNVDLNNYSFSVLALLYSNYHEDSTCTLTIPRLRQCQMSDCTPKATMHQMQQLSRRMTKQTKWLVRPTKAQISLGIHPVWSESSLSEWINIGPLTTYWAHSENWSDWANAQADLILSWAHMSFCWFCLAAAQLLLLVAFGALTKGNGFYIQKVK